MEPNPSGQRPAVCPACGAAFVGEAKYCWLCGWKLGDIVDPAAKPDLGTTANPYSSPAPKQPDLNWTFNLSTLFLWTALVAVVLGVWRIAPGLGAVLAVLAVPAALHTVGLAAYRKRKSGLALTVPEKILAFIASFALFLAIAVAVAIAAVGALFVVCASMFVRNSANPAAANHSIATAIVVTVLGVILMLLFAFFIARGLWRRKV